VTPIPADARARDPRWAIAYLELANGMVLAGAKAKLIERFTDLPHRRVTELYKALLGTPPPAGPIMQGNARYFTVPSRETSESWIIQCAVFLACYEQIGTITTMALQRGWRLLAAFNSYQSLTEAISRTGSVRRLDINQGYALLTYCGFLSGEGAAEIKRAQCPTCFIRYPVLAATKPGARRCPVCALDANLRRLAEQAGAASQVFHASQAR
jgi:Flagellar transcriptional activator (FlhC)